MTEAEQFAVVDTYPGSTMVAWSDMAIAMRYMQHRLTKGVRHGLIAAAHDVRDGTGIVVMWRDPVPANELHLRQANCMWLLEEILAGRYPRPVPGQVGELWSGGFPSQTRH